jgi:TfoX/Sxy family transcriptional regulator of competence genes
MAYNEQLADRVRELIAAGTTHTIEEKRMFGGLCFMVDDKICVGVKQASILVRLDPALFEEALEKEGCTPMMNSRRTAKGYVFVDEAVLGTQKQLAYWVKLALDFNPFAKSTKKK